MTSSAPFLAVALLAVLVGAALPVMYQLYKLLRRAHSVLDAAGPRLEKTLDQVGQAADRLNGIGTILETQARALEPLIEAASRMGHSLDRTGHRLRTAMAVWPAVVAGARAFFSGVDDEQQTDDRQLLLTQSGGTT